MFDETGVTLSVIFPNVWPKYSIPNSRLPEVAVILLVFKSWNWANLPLW